MNIVRIGISLFKRDLIRQIKFASKIELQSKENLRLLQEEKFKKLIAHAKSNVPYYKEKLNEISGVADIAKIDFLEKEDIRNNVDRLKALNMDEDRFYSDSTSGSTGDSLHYFRDKKNEYRRAVGYRCDKRPGYDIGSKVLYLWGAERDILEKRSLYVKFKDKYVHKIKMLSTYHMTDNDIDNYIEIYNKFRPAVIIAYPTPLFHLASYIEKNDIKIRQLKGIITSSETLFPFQREKIEKIFNCKIYNRYGCREVGNMASECKAHNGLHINTDRFVFEIVDANGDKCRPGELGEIVLTDLDNYAFPLIRYRIGDLGIMSKQECTCGINLPLLEKVEGRVFDLIVGVNGNVVGGTFWTLLRRKIKGWNKFQLVQEDYSQLKIEVENNTEIESDFKEKVVEAIKEKLGSQMEITVNIIDKIALTKTGKHRWIISKVSPYAR